MVSSDSESEDLEKALSKLKTNNTFDGSKHYNNFITNFMIAKISLFKDERDFVEVNLYFI
jgi:hypothetical protein